MIAERSPMLIGRHLQADDARTIHIDDHALNHRDDIVARQRILPRLKHRMPYFGLNQVHVAHVALVLLEGGNVFRIGRPDEDGAVTVRPSGVVGSVAEVFHPIGGELRLFAAGNIANPKVPIADECGELAVGRGPVDPHRRRSRHGRKRRLLPLPRAASFGSTLRALHIALPVAPFHIELDRLLVRRQFDLLKRQVPGVVTRVCSRRQRCGKFGLLKQGRSLAGGCIDHYEFAALGSGFPKPEAIVLQPRRAQRPKHQRCRVISHEPLRPRIVVSGERTTSVGGLRGSDSQRK